MRVCVHASVCVCVCVCMWWAGVICLTPLDSTCVICKIVNIVYNCKVVWRYELLWEKALWERALYIIIIIINCRRRGWVLLVSLINNSVSWSKPAAEQASKWLSCPVLQQGRHSGLRLSREPGGHWLWPCVRHHLRGHRHGGCQSTSHHFLWGICQKHVHESVLWREVVDVWCPSPVVESQGCHLIFPAFLCSCSSA